MSVLRELMGSSHVDCFQISASAARGKEAGDDLTQTNTRINAGNTVVVRSGGDTTLQGALVKADRIQAEVGGHLLIESLQNTSTYASRQKSVGASVTIGAGAGGSFSASSSRVNSDFTSVAEQSGFKAGDGGFVVGVRGNTELIGGAITSNQSAVADDKNSFTTDGTLTVSDIENQAKYSAKSASVGISSGGASGSGAGIGSYKGNTSSTTTSGISGIAGDTAMRSTDAETGIQRIFDKERVQKEVEAQVAITKAFGQQASKAVGDYAGRKFEELKQSDPEEAAKWAEGGVYRSMAHAVVGGLTGGAGGALGAGAADLSADAINQLTQDLPEGVRNVVGAAVAAGIGAMAGGSVGAASAFNADTNNRQLHPTERQLARELARKSADRYTPEQIEEQMRLMGNSAFKATPNSTEVLTTPEAIANNINRDPSMPKTSDGKVVVEVPGQANAAIQQFIIGNSTNGANYIPGQSPYIASNAVLNPRSTTYSPGNTSATAACANSDLACKSGIGVQQSSIPELTDAAKNILADSAAVTSRAAGVVAAGATAVGAQGGPYGRPAQIVAAGATAVGVAADGVEQAIRPNIGGVANASLITYFQEWADARAPGAAPVTNEVVELWKNSGTGQSLETWVNTQWKSFLERSK